MFAVLLPVMLILCFMAINLSYMQLTQTELKIGTDAAARAGGRAWSNSQSLSTARDFARQAAELNMVSGRPLVLGTNEADGEIVFGSSVRGAGGGRYEFSPIDDLDIQGGTIASGVRVTATHPTSLLFELASIGSFTPSATSVASQIDRDIALVIDRSSSMGFYRDADALRNVIDGLRDAGTIDGVEANDARRYRSYSDNVLDHLSGEILEYAISRNATRGTGAAVHSRWSVFLDSIGLFFNIVNDTAQNEQVSVSSFASNSRVDIQLTQNMTLAENAINSLVPNGSTAIGDGLLSAVETLRTPAARATALKSMIVLTDGIPNGGSIDAVVAAQQIVAANPDIVIYTITFTPVADQNTMARVAAAANGRHFHADTAEQLDAVFEEIALTLPTIVTE